MGKVKEAHLHARLKPEQKHAWEEEAHRLRITVNELVRQIANRFARKHARQKEAK